MDNSLGFKVFADYNQFYLMDAVVQPLIPGEITPEDMDRRIRTAEHIVVFHTESAATVPVDIRILDAEPERETTWDHEATFDLDLPSGEAALCGCTEYVPDAPRIKTAKGLHSGKAYYAGSHSPGGERYVIALWRTPVSGA